MNVMFFLPHLGGGGAEMNAVRLADGMHAAGVRTTYVVTHGPGEYAEYLPATAEVVVLPTGSFNSSTVRLLRSVGPLARLINARKPDILCPVMPVPALVALNARRLSLHKPQVVISIQSSMQPPTQKRLAMVKRIEHFLVPRMFPSADLVIALSEGVKKEIEHLVPQLVGRTRVVYNVGLPLDRQSVATSEALPSRPPAGRVRFLACGRLVEAKGYPYLLHAFHQVAKRIDAELHILGRGPMLSELALLAKQLDIENRVSFLGFCRNPLVHMQAADIFVLSSLWEGFGNVIIEAMSMGVPVIATRCPHGPAEIISDGRNGILTQPANSDALAAAMTRLASDSELRSCLAAAGYRRAQDFSAARIGREYCDHMLRLTTAKASMQSETA